MTVEIRHLRAFLAIAEERNLTRAANRLHLTQPALSRTLAQLERLLEVRLVDRSTHHVELTEVGQRFEQRAFDAVRSFETALADVTGRGLPLRLGHSWSAGIHLAAILRAWNAQPRPCDIVVIRRDDRSAGLTSGAVDAALTRGPLDSARFRSVVIDRELRMAVLHRSHPLARRRHLRLDELSREPLVATSVGVTTPELWPEGQRPIVSTEVSTVDDWLVAIASGAGFGVTVASTAKLHPHPDVRYVPVDDAPLVALLLGWPRRGAHPALAELRRLALDAR
ncbi:MAG: LysR family transcriptional regulator [Actinobacteria bacterium]|nr:LysR family transcriptional regulator [Actinomycetota bacterium]